MTQKENVLKLIESFHKKFEEKVTKDLTKAGIIVKEFNPPYPGSMDFAQAQVYINYKQKSFVLSFSHSGMGYILSKFPGKQYDELKSYQSVESLMKRLNQF